MMKFMMAAATSQRFPQARHNLIVIHIHVGNLIFPSGPRSVCCGINYLIGIELGPIVARIALSPSVEMVFAL